MSDGDTHTTDDPPLPTRESSFSFSTGSPFSSPGQVVPLPAAAPPPAEPPASLVTFASIRKLRERCPSVDMRTCKEALRMHGSDVDLAAAFLQDETVAPAASQDLDAEAAPATPRQAAVLRDAVDESPVLLPAPSPAPSTAPVEAPASAVATSGVATLCALLATVTSASAVPATEDAPISAVPAATEGASSSDAPAAPDEDPVNSWPGFDASRSPSFSDGIAQAEAKADARAAARQLAEAEAGAARAARGRTSPPPAAAAPQHWIGAEALGSAGAEPHASAPQHEISTASPTARLSPTGGAEPDGEAASDAAAALDPP
eukprot:scaffold8931_cov65-Phaeocystis_antarctica.AAC.8